MSGTDRTDDAAIRVGPIEVAPVDGRVHVSVGVEGVTTATDAAAPIWCTRCSKRSTRRTRGGQSAAGGSE